MTPADLLDQLPDMERQAEDYERKAQAIRQIIAGIRALNGEASAVLSRRFEAHATAFDVAPRPADAPRGPDAVLEVMRQEPDREWKVVELKRELLRRGWAPSPKAVEASVKRLRERGTLRNTSFGFYVLARPVASYPTDDASDQEVRPASPAPDH